MTRATLAAVTAVAVLALAAPAALAQAGPPETLEYEGETLVLNGAETGRRFFVDLYNTALYLPEESSDLGFILNPENAKVFRIEMLYGGQIPDQLPENWRDELIPPLDPEEAAQLSERFGELEQGDVVLMAYTPESGSQILIEDEVVVRSDDTRVIAGAIDLWLGEDPVSADIRAALLRESG